MDKISYFKLQAKNLFRDYKMWMLNEEGKHKYSPKFFGNIDELIADCGINEEKFTLMKAQHVVAKLAGFKRWSDLTHASDSALVSGSFLFYFKLQVGNLFYDYKTQTLDGEGLTKYLPVFFDDIEWLLLAYGVDESNFTLTDARDLIADLAGFENWSDLLNASNDALELGKLLLDKRNEHLLACMGDPLDVSWKMYLQDNRLENLSDKDKLVIFKGVYLNESPNGEKLDNEEELKEFDERLVYEDYGYDKELADYFRELDELTDEIEQKYYKGEIV